MLSSSAAPAAIDTIYLFPFMLDFALSPVSLIVRVGTGGAGSSVKAGIWANNATTMRPTGVPLLANNTGAATTSSNASATLSVSGARLSAGVVYWAGSKYTGTLPTVVGVFLNDITTAVLCGLALASTAGGSTMGFSAPDTYSNNITATDLTGATFTAVTGTTGIPLLQVGT